MHLIGKTSRKSWTFPERTDIIYTMRNVFKAVKYIPCTEEIPREDKIENEKSCEIWRKFFGKRGTV